MSTPAPAPTPITNKPVSRATSSDTKNVSMPIPETGSAMLAASNAGSLSVTSNPIASDSKKVEITKEHADNFDINNPGIMDTITKLLFEGSSILSNLDPASFEMFGKMSSHEYRKLFFKVTKDLDNSCKIWLIILFTAIKSKPRVLNAMARFSKENWYNSTRDFIIQKMVQYTKELPADGSKFAAVHVPHIMPSFTAICWIKITPMHLRTTKNFLSNLWACQMDLPLDLMEFQKMWEIGFWNGTVKISRNVARDNVELEFHEDFWATKAADKYPFYDPTGALIEVKNENDLKAWIDSWSAYKV